MEQLQKTMNTVLDQNKNLKKENAHQSTEEDREIVGLFNNEKSSSLSNGSTTIRPTTPKKKFFKC